jgi:hypothetical protein
MKEDQKNLPEMERKGYGYLNPFRRYQKKGDEEVDITLVKQRSHVNFTFHLPVPKNFNRRTVLPPEQMRLLRETAAKNRYKKKQLEKLLNE